MSKLFYLSEIVKFAIEKEQESIELYTKLAEQAEQAEVKAIFQRLVQEEQKHKIFYGKMLEGIKVEQSPGVKEDADYDAYMMDIINSSRQAKALSADDIKNVIVALDYAIAREKDAVLFYTGLKNYVSSDDHPQVNVIIQEEEKHASILAKVKKDYR